MLTPELISTVVQSASGQGVLGQGIYSLNHVCIVIILLHLCAHLQVT